METIERKDALTFHKWNSKGQTIDVVVTEAPVFDKLNDFNSEDNYFRGVLTGTEDRIQVNMPYDLKQKVRPIKERIKFGETRFIITWTDTKPMKKGKAPMKIFDVQAEGLIPF